jgi:hypothetical protein
MRRVFEAAPRHVHRQAVRSGRASGRHYDGRRKDLGLRDLIESDGGIVPAGVRTLVRHERPMETSAPVAQCEGHGFGV